MPSRNTHFVRSMTVGCALAAAVVVSATPATAAPEPVPAAEPAFASHFLRTNFFSGDPFPFGYEVLDAATNGTGIVRLTAGQLCNQLGQYCAPGSAQLSVQWINFATGASGGTTIGGTQKTITTGRGPVGITVSASYSAGIPGFGLINP